MYSVTVNISHLIRVKHNKQRMILLGWINSEKNPKECRKIIARLSKDNS